MTHDDLTRRRRWFAVLAVMTALGVAAFLALFLSDLIEAHRRLTPWKSGVVWVSEAVAAFWFLQFCFATFIRSEKVDERAHQPTRHRWKVALTVASILLGWAIDLIVTVDLSLDDRRAFARAIPAVATVRSVEGPSRGQGTGYFRTRFVFRATDGRVYDACWDFVAPVEWVPRHLQKAILFGDTPFPMEIKYDPLRPQRCWPRALPYEHGYNTVFNVSLVGLFGQAICIVVFFWLLYRRCARSGGIPWWV